MPAPELSLKPATALDDIRLMSPSVEFKFSYQTALPSKPAASACWVRVYFGRIRLKLLLKSK